MISIKPNNCSNQDKQALLTTLINSTSSIKSSSENYKKIVLQHLSSNYHGRNINVNNVRWLE